MSHQGAQGSGEGSSSSKALPTRPSVMTHTDTSVGSKKKRHRAGKKRKNRRQSFAAPSDIHDEDIDDQPSRPNLLDVPEGSHPRDSFYRLNNRNESSTSLDSEVLLDHRYAPSPLSPASPLTGNSRHQNAPPRVRRSSTHQTVYSHRSAQEVRAARPSKRFEDQTRHGNDGQDTDLSPLLGRSNGASNQGPKTAYGGLAEALKNNQTGERSRRDSGSSTKSNRRKMPSRQLSMHSQKDYDVNNPPSVPGSPRLGSNNDYDDVMLPEFSSKSMDSQRSYSLPHGGDALIDIDVDDENSKFEHFTKSPRSPVVPFKNSGRRRQSIHSPVEDVCVPFDQMTDIGDEDFMHQQGEENQKVRRSRKRPWPDLSALEEWAEEEKQALHMEGETAKKVNDPLLIGGRLRPQKGAWRPPIEDAPFRWTYFNEELDSSLRSHTISGLQQLGHSFKELFIPEPPELDDSSSDEEEDDSHGGYGAPHDRSATPVNGGIRSNGDSRSATRQSSILEHRGFERSGSDKRDGDDTPRKPQSAERKPKRYGPRPVFWLDVLQPTYDEMRVISRAFGIHKLTAEDIMEQEAREKVELFRNYYFVNYRTFEQDEKSEDYLEPVNMYFVVFKGGVISFHFSQMPHPPNVRRRIRQLAEHQYTDSDWISYAIIDNITDAYAPLIEQIEHEVDDIDDEILQLHNRDPAEIAEAKRKKENKNDRDYEKVPQTDTEVAAVMADAGMDMLVRVGECRRKVMGLYRLLGNKADVIKGLAKRCNEQWSVAPKSDVGLYLGDIQDHIVTMTGNLTHYENILARAHSNYLAQINIKMNERAEKTSDVLGKLTVLGTIVLPMNIITGMWGMNSSVPGEGSIAAFWWLTGFLALFGLTCFFIAKKVYKLV